MKKKGEGKVREEVLIFLPTLGKKTVFPHSNFASPIPYPFILPFSNPFLFTFSFSSHFPFLFLFPFPLAFPFPSPSIPFPFFPSPSLLPSSHPIPFFPPLPLPFPSSQLDFLPQQLDSIPNSGGEVVELRLPLFPQLHYNAIGWSWVNKLGGRELYTPLVLEGMNNHHAKFEVNKLKTNLSKAYRSVAQDEYIIR